MKQAMVMRGKVRAREASMFSPRWKRRRAMLSPRWKRRSPAGGLCFEGMSRYAIADVAALVGEPTRAAILLALLDGRALPAGELASAASLSAAATSIHLGKL